MNRTRYAILLALVLSGCAHLGLSLQAPSFRAADAQPGQIQLFGPSMRHPMGGLQLRLFAHVTNPNPLALTLTRIAGTLSLEGTRAASVNLPLGLPLPAAGDTIIPLDIEIGFSDLPALAEIVPRALDRGTVAYDLEGSFSVDAGLLGQPSFGPMTLLDGVVRAR